MRAYLTDVTARTHPAGTRFEVGGLCGSPWRVALGMTGDGNTTAAVLVERAISLFTPQALLFVGIAGALADDIALGDVIVPTRIYAYHGGREEPDEFHVRPRAWEVPHHLEQLARHVERSKSWIELLTEKAQERTPVVHFRPIAAGEVVINSRSSALARQIQRHYNDAAAVEMESAGVAQASHLNRSLPAITVRGISDTASGDKDGTDRIGWQPVAAAHAAAFALAIVAELSPASVAAATDAQPSANQEKARPGTSESASEADRAPRRRMLAGVLAAMIVVVALVLAFVTIWPDPGQPGGNSGSERNTTAPSAPFTPRRTGDPNKSPSVQQERTVELVVDDPQFQTIHMDYWRTDAKFPGDLGSDGQRLYTSTGAGIALLPEGQAASYAHCADLSVSAWVIEIALINLKPGTQLCGYTTEDRYAMLEVISLPSANDRRFVFFGRTWHRPA